MQKQLYNIGVDMQFEVVPIEEYDTRIREGRFDAVLIDMISGPTSARPHVFWASARRFKGLNVFGYENAEAERLFELLRTSTNEAAVRSAISRLQRVLLDDPPALFLAWNERARAVRREFPASSSRAATRCSQSGDGPKTPIDSRSRPSEEDLDPLRAADGGGGGRAAARVRRRVDLSLRTGAQQAVIDGNLNVARQVAEQIELYVTGSVKILKAVGADLQQTGLERWQQDRILKNFVLSSPSSGS